jgi:hypothetical protein
VYSWGSTKVCGMISNASRCFDDALRACKRAMFLTQRKRLSS